MRFAKYAAALVLFVLVFAAPTYAQNNKPIISGTWYEDRAASQIQGSSGIVLTFAQTPANKFLDITHVTCSILTQPTQFLAFVTLNAGSTSGANDLGRPMSIRGNAASEASTSIRYYSLVNDQIIYKLGPGRYPSILIGTALNGGGSPTLTVDCVIVGELKDN